MNKQNKHKIYIWLLIAMCSVPISPISVVYFLRVSQVGTQLESKITKPSLMIVTGFGEWAKTRDQFHQRAVGVWGNYRYDQPSWSLSINSAVGQVRNNACNLKFKRTQSDDLLFIGSYKPRPLSEKASCTISGYFGVPTHRDTVLEGLEFGTGHYGTGAQFDLNYIYNETQNTLYAVRLIHFFPRNAANKVTKDPTARRFALGDQLDIYISHLLHWNKDHTLGVGYDGTFSFNINLKPAIINFAPALNYTLHTFFIYYIRDVMIQNREHSFVLFVSSGFENRPKCFAYKYTAGIFVSWSINF